MSDSLFKTVIGNILGCNSVKAKVNHRINYLYVWWVFTFSYYDLFRTVRIDELEDVFWNNKNHMKKCLFIRIFFA